MKICDENNCTGCSACLNICPQNAVSVIENQQGALVSNVNDSCINCGACVKVCPINKQDKQHGDITCYAAWSKFDDLRENCASGGISSSLAKEMINTGGVVFGTKYQEKQLVFSYATKPEQLNDFIGSKYVYPYIGETFKQVKEFCVQGRSVLFVGLPCQVAGLKAYLKKSYDNLILVDLLCHGTMPIKYLNEYINQDYDNILFKGKFGSSLVAEKNGKVVYNKRKESDLLYMAYAKGLLHRENCYDCKFANLNRQGDITIGDFWGLNTKQLNIKEINPKRVSLVLANNDKGKNFFENAKEYIEYDIRSVEEALPGNKQLSVPCKKHKDREKFMFLYKEKGIRYAIKHTEIQNIVRRNIIHSLIIGIASKIIPSKFKKIILRRIKL